MIRLTRLNHGPFLLNSDLIEHIEITPDTVITLTNGHQFMVREEADEVVRRIVEFRRTVNANCFLKRISDPVHTDTESQDLE
ncbi:MAG TPA: flagellar FlbD family protein [Bryobacteraceae bacterium]|nr:flagellar FlbD family protein [Bryobacteraceae bacterium]HOQ45469.1 flagellar FlbD family protein [Bryobacteraceae bacterium]HPQ15720.1 flagellar FlbD family protein [Bryobacteraceae bacterium]HPU73677.1 flagellar FlbD family protein [Bryobacteraceae bacterium]